MTARPEWLIEGEQSGKLFVTAPGSTESAEAVKRLDESLSDLKGPKPGWYRVLQRTGRWWYVICMAITTPVVMLIADVEWPIELSAGLAAGVALATLSGAGASLLAGLQARSAAKRRDQIRPVPLRHVVRQARIPEEGVIESILAWDPAAETALHDVVWRGAQFTDSDGDAAREELLTLWERAAPEAAAAHRAEIEELERKIQDLKDKGVI